MAGSNTRAFNESEIDQVDSPKLNNALLKLLSAQNQNLVVSKQKLKQLSKYKQDYEALEERLKTLPDRVSHEVMVPLGKYAFIPGHLKHTNEILVLLGENWFAQRSAKQSAEIVRRRIERCEEMIKQLSAEVELRQNWEKSTRQQHHDMVKHLGWNFIEEEDEETWREQHRKKVKEYRQKLADMRKKGIASEAHEDASTEEADIWRRLDELELQEELEHELDLLGSEEEDIKEEEEEEEEDQEDQDLGYKEETEEPNNSDDNFNENDDSAKSRKGVTWSETDSVRQFRIDEILSKNEPLSESADTLKIHFKHTPLKKSTPVQSTAVEEIISSPSDIFRKFCKMPEAEVSEPKSILKVKKSTTPVIETLQDESPPPQRQHKTQFTAVGDEVKEHVLMEPKQEVTSGEVTCAEVNTHRPVSRFKAARLNRKL